MNNEPLNSPEDTFVGSCFADYRSALLGAELVYNDESTHRFYADGRTVHTRGLSTTTGTWRLTRGGKLTLSWPNRHRKSFHIGWARDDTVVVGLSLTERTSGETTIGRFRFVIDSPGALSQE